MDLEISANKVQNGSHFVSASVCQLIVTQWCHMHHGHNNDVIMSMTASQITSLTIVYSTVYSRRRSKKTSKLHVTGLCEGNSPVTDEFPAQRASNAKIVSNWWRHHEIDHRWLCDIFLGTNMAFLPKIVWPIIKNSVHTVCALGSYQTLNFIICYDVH